MSLTVDLVCAHCGQGFTLYRSQINRGRGRFCSVTCGVRARGGSSEVRPCAQCQRPFTARGSAIAKGHGVTCSGQCRRRFLAAKAQQPPVHRSCHTCGGRFVAAVRQHQKRRFCSRACFYRWNQGDRRFNWKGGITADPDYGRIASAKRRALTLAASTPTGVTRDEWRAVCAEFGHRCPKCGRHEREIGTLTMDHITPLSRGGRHHKANIQPLCQPCNSSKGQRTIGFAPDGGAVELTDFRALMAAIGRGELPLTLVELNYDALDQLAAATNGLAVVPGIEFYQVEAAQ